MVKRGNDSISEKNREIERLKAALRERAEVNTLVCSRERDPDVSSLEIPAGGRRA